jgi:2-polyprenyl-3-methyl-5-hydroxy-6-metoxy-1,4-benzoquinol methylase
MNTTPTLNARYQKIQDLLDRNGNRCTPEEFRQIVNVVFHRYESAQYDELHRCMWESLPVIFRHLANDSIPHLKSNSRLLDVGCGTGLSTALLLSTPVGPRIGSGTFVDTSPEMIEVARRRARQWALQCRFEVGTISDLRERFDLILVSSVMHHIPDLSGFLKEVAERLSPGGLFVHLQDPNGDADSAVINLRKQQLAEQESSKRLSLLDRVKMRLRPQDRYIHKTNQELLRRGIISSPLADEEIWAVTDIHDDDRGISLQEIGQALDALMTPIRTSSYAFFGKMASELPVNLRTEEDRLLESGDMNGTIMCGVWSRS